MAATFRNHNEATFLSYYFFFILFIFFLFLVSPWVYIFQQFTADRPVDGVYMLPCRQAVNDVTLALKMQAGKMRGVGSATVKTQRNLSKELLHTFQPSRNTDDKTCTADASKCTHNRLAVG